VIRQIGAAFAATAVLVLVPPQSGASVAERHVASSATFDSGILHVERFGEAGRRAIIFVPALFCGSWQWNAQINTLSAKYTVLVVTLPGFDGRPMVASDDLMQGAANSLHSLIATQGLNRPILVGHSLGGTLAVYFAERYPRDVTSVVSVEGGYPIAPTQAERDAQVAQNVAPYDGVAPRDVGRVIVQDTLQYTITSKADVSTLEAFAAKSDPAAIIAWMRAALSLDLTPDLAKITVPFTVIIPFDPQIDPYVGFKTEDAKQAAYSAWAAHAAQSKVILIEPSRHFVMFDQAEKFEQALQTGIER
jgi:pimeloyl-ACP methyl ester carboxylesterase